MFDIQFLKLLKFTNKKSKTFLGFSLWILGNVGIVGIVGSMCKAPLYPAYSLSPVSNSQRLLTIPNS